MLLIFRGAAKKVSVLRLVVKSTSITLWSQWPVEPNQCSRLCIHYAGRLRWLLERMVYCIPSHLAACSVVNWSYVRVVNPVRPAQGRHSDCTLDQRGFYVIATVKQLLPVENLGEYTTAPCRDFPWYILVWARVHSAQRVEWNARQWLDLATVYILTDYVLHGQLDSS